MAFFRTLKAVAWSFIGLRNSKGFDEDTKLNPLHVVAIGIGAALTFVVLLIVFVHWVVKT